MLHSGGHNAVFAVQQLRPSDLANIPALTPAQQKWIAAPGNTGSSNSGCGALCGASNATTTRPGDPPAGSYISCAYGPCQTVKNGDHPTAPDANTLTQTPSGVCSSAKHRRLRP
jgi:hypothetical protein